MKVLVVGAGASLEEFNQVVGPNHPECFPLINNFAKKTFEECLGLQFALAEYLTFYNIKFNPRIFDFYQQRATGPWSKEDVEPTPLTIFINLESEDTQNHNVEKFYEFAWHKYFKQNEGLWREIIQFSILHGIYFRYIKHFHENGIGYKSMIAGAKVCEFLSKNDKVVNLNYDVCFDLAIKQRFGLTSYSPDNLDSTITMYKPHGSLNLYANHQLGRFKFIDPEELPGTGSYRDKEGGLWETIFGYVPPMLNKSYEQIPIAKVILNGLDRCKPNQVVFWGVGLTNSDKGLLLLYKKLSSSALSVEIINPDKSLFSKYTEELRHNNIKQFTSLDDWVASKKA